VRFCKPVSGRDILFIVFTGLISGLWREKETTNIIFKKITPSYLPLSINQCTEQQYQQILLYLSIKARENYPPQYPDEKMSAAKDEARLLFQK